MRKTVTIILIFSMLMTLTAGCGSQQGTDPAGTSAVPKQTESQNQTSPSGTQQTEPESFMEILDKEGHLLGRIANNASAMATDAGIFYCLFAPAENQYTATAEYRLFRAEDKSDILLGTLEDQGYEAIYDRTEYNGFVYALALSGNPYDQSPDTLWLLAFDLSAGTMARHLITKKGNPYGSLAASNGKLLIVSHEATEPSCDKVYEFDPASGAVKEILTVSEKGGDDKGSLRSVCAAEDGFYLLRLRMDSGSEAELFLDHYDGLYRKVSEQSLNELCQSAMDINGIVSRDDLINELRMLVSGFAVTDGRYLYYENFSITRLVIDLKTGETLLAKDDLWSMSLGGGKPVIYQLDFGSYEDSGKPVIKELQDGEFCEVEFQPADSHTLLQGVSRSPGGTWLLNLTDVFSASEGTSVLYLWKEP